MKIIAFDFDKKLRILTTLYKTFLKINTSIGFVIGISITIRKILTLNTLYYLFV